MISHILFTANEVITNDYTNTHQAIDVVGENRSISDVIAYEDGTVVFVVNNVKTNNTNTTGNATYGNFIKIKHNNNVQTLYAHLKYGSIKVKSGDTVKKGQVIATMGNTGRAFGVHLHFEIMDYKNNRKNPHDYLWNTNVTSSNNIEKVSSNVKTDENINNKTLQENTEKNEEKDSNNIESEPNIIENEYNSENKNNSENEKNLENNSENNILNDENINNEFTLFENSEYKYLSLSDALSEIYVNNNFDYRTLLAEKNGITNYTGSKIQNLKLLQMLKNGSLKAVY